MQQAVEMPSSDVLMMKLEEEGLLGLLPELDRFYGAFIDDIAGTTRNPQGIFTAWQIARCNTFAGFPPAVADAADMDFEFVVDAIFPNPTIAEAVKNCRLQLLRHSHQEYPA